jgi:lipoate-protein ligase A
MTHHASRPWRLLLAFDQPGAWHMATDDALHAAFVPGRDRPILRLYSWAPACLSLGYGQPSTDVDLAACRQAGIDLVRRPTGGRAVLHDHELTYAVIAATDDPIVGGSIAQSYRAIAAGLLAGLRALGVDAVLAAGSPGGDLAARRSGACFAVATRHEIVWRGHKLAGSAQLRRGGVLLQHGSLLLAHGQTALAALLRATPAATRLADHLAAASATVADALGQAPTPATAARLVAPAFAAALGLTLRPDQLTPAEAALAERLCHDRYATDTWTQRR